MLLYIGEFLIILFLLLSVVAPKKYNLTVGEIAAVDIKAPIDTIDEAATKDKIDQIVSTVDKKYTEKSEVKTQSIYNVSRLFEKMKLEKATSKEESEKLEAVKTIEEFKLTDEEYITLINIGEEKLNDMNKSISDILELVYKDNIQDGNYEDIQIAKGKIDSNIEKYGYERNLEDIIKEISYSQIKPNLFYDKEKTEEKISEAKKSIEKEIIKKNQIIVKEGEPVTQSQLNILKELGLLNGDNTKGSITNFLAITVIILLVLLIQKEYIRKELPEVFKSKKNLLLINVINIITLLIAIGTNMLSPYLIPVLCGAMLITILIDSRASLVVNLTNIIFISIIIGFDPIVILISIVSVILGTVSLKKVQQRNDIIYATAYITIVVSLLTFATNILSSNNTKEILIRTTYTAIGALVSGILALGLLPFFESIFDVVTNIKLLELSNPNQPLMKKLLMEAPGTYHHSIMVANLAEAATEAIGGNPVIVRVGAYYHDIGKIKRPYFFGENQMGKENPHDKITPNLSTMIILSHVKDGIEMAKEYNIPKILQDMIVQHHGTTLVKYFYYKMKNSSENPEEVKEEDFRYPGPIPDTKEAGVLMLADGVEASVRSISEPTKEKIEEMVNNIINDKLNSNQLINCDLTLKDIDTIKKCFLKSLDGIYHHRIEYPKEKK
ncbi:HDIG domain-containing metalloprotein [Clostridium sp.]|uniref:HD family phosphohydrolase n=1 Tax=Clostridium sp. TaxID=1506 RepID=UPI00262F5C64|nr:HDIG domain-containing metalloprotein [Clostridium sp.]